MSSIAARLGDHHVCPAHLGAEVLPACAPTILVAGFPAARVGDQLMCHRVKDIAVELITEKLLPWVSPPAEAPLDTIKLGESTVLLEGKAAARFADPTAHGGLLDDGCPTVIIGSMTAEAKRLRLMERLRLINAARAKAAGMPAGAEQSRLLAAADRLAKNNKSVEYARLCDAVYDGSKAPEGWKRLTGDTQFPFVDDATGFYSALYRSEIDGSYVLAYRGTTMTSWKDWVFGNSQSLGKPAPQYLEAVVVAKLVQGVHGEDLTLTGHSLGGGQASVAALATGLHATTINAAGVAPETDVLFSLDRSKADGLIDAYHVEDEVLTWIQEDSPVAFRVPDAIGTQHVLPAANEDGTLRPMPEGALDGAGESAERHGRIYGIYGFEALKNADVATILGML